MSGNGKTTLRAVAAAAHTAQAKKLGTIIRDTRNAQRLNRQTLAKEIGCSIASIRDTESGRIRVKTLRLLADHPAFAGLPERCRQAGINLLDWTWGGGWARYGTAGPGSGGTPGSPGGGSDPEDGGDDPEGDKGKGGPK
jgi:hypothetical protein